ncbi:SLATT domain-containing protein [Levilactobacillus brevis]|nr:SLATT domain-containing protein [Levilactobacillus brevis]
MLKNNENTTDVESIKAAIKKKADGWKRTRSNRISASERLKGYSSKWNMVTFIFNVEAVLFMVISLKYPILNGIDAVISGFFSLYVILLQYFLATLNYEARALKFHYEELQIENLRLRLKQLYHSSKSAEQLSSEYNGITREYQENLTGYENHGEIDDLRTTAKKKVSDYSIENMFIYANFIIVIAAPVLFACQYVL